MSAQPGDSVVLGYRPHGAQQLGSAVLLSDSAPVNRKTVADFHAPWHVSTVHHVPARALWPTAKTAQISPRAPWAPGRPQHAVSRPQWAVSKQVDIARSNAWQQYAQLLGFTPVMPWGLASSRDIGRSGLWGEYTRQLGFEPLMPWGLSRKEDAAQTGPWGQCAARLSRSAGAGWTTAVTADRAQWHPWRRFSRTLHGDWMVVVPPPAPGDDPQALFYILPARFYMTAHTITAHRLPDMADLPIYTATVAADAGSYCWSLSASGPASLFDLLAPVAGLPAQIQVTLDGIPFVFAVDSLSRSASFGQTGVSMQGRSVTALIGAPYMVSQSRIESQDRTAQQLVMDALDLTGIDLDWGTGSGAVANGGMVDWLVPAGAYSRQGTPLEAVSRIVQAAGGYLQSHRSAATLLARHPYGRRVGDVSGAPWDWSTGAADVELAPDAIITEAIERKDGADINAVYVSGTSAGVLAWVKRAGTAGDKLAAMATDSLITHTDAARQRGLAVLGAAGNKYNVRIELPVLTEAGQPGVLDVGQLVQVNASTPWRGRVRAVSVNAARPSLRQSVTLERHLA